MNTAFMAGNLVEVSSTYIWDDHRFVQKPRTNRGASIHQHGEMTVVRRSSRYRLRGARVETSQVP